MACSSGCHNHKVISVGISADLVLFNEGPAASGGRQLYLITRSEKENKSIDMELALPEFKWKRLVEALSSVLNGPPNEFYFYRPNTPVQDEDDFKVVASGNQPARKHYVMIQMNDNPYEPGCDRWLSLSDNSIIAIIKADAEVQNFFTHGF